MEVLNHIIENLKEHKDVDAVFLTGSQGKENKAYSDIDLVIILNKNTRNIKSLYTWIGNKFADVFFFDHGDIERIESAKELPGNSLDGLLISWIEKGIIQFDKSGKITELKEKSSRIAKVLSIPKLEKELFWQKINYNIVANKRYFESGDPLYHEALEVRLLYCVSELFTGYFEFRDVVWRGEKNALKFLKQYDTDFYNAFIQYTKAAGLKEKYDSYIRLTHLVFPEGYTFWLKGDVIPQPKDREKSETESEMILYWKDLTKIK